MEKYDNKVTELDAVEIHEITLRGIESKYEFSLIKCNKGGYIVMRGQDVGAYLGIDEALDFLKKDIKKFMGEPTPPELPRAAPPPPPIHGIERLNFNEVRRPIASVTTVDERRWTNGEIL